MMVKNARLMTGILIACSILLAAPIHARAQFNPFHGARNVPPLTRGDFQMLNESAGKLNADPRAHVGQVESWTNPASGASGTTTLTGVFQSSGMTCHALRYNITVRKRSGSTTYNATWCLTPSGEWKIKS